MRLRATLAALLFLATLAAPPVGGFSEQTYVVTFAQEPSPVQRLEILARDPAAVFFTIVPSAKASLTDAQARDVARLPFVLRVDPERPVEKHLDQAARLVRAGTAIESLGATGRGVTVAVVDSGIDTTHPDFPCVLANVKYAHGAWHGSPSDLDGHGTHVAGIVAGSGGESGGRYRGVAPGACLVGLDFSVSFTTTAALSAFDWILTNKDRYNIRVVSNSWGRAERDAHYDAQDPLQRAIQRLTDEGIVVVFSAGNGGPGPSTLSSEAQNPHAITVGGTDKAGVLGSYSGRGPAVGRDRLALDFIKPDLVAPGSSVVSARSASATGDPTSRIVRAQQADAVSSARYLELSGTSQAAPFVAGIVAAMLEANPSLTPARVKNILREAAIDLGPRGPDPEYGFGLVDGRDAVLLARNLPEDHGNVLVAGGAEEWTQTGTFTSSAGGLLGATPASGAAPSTIQFVFPVKQGATRVTFDFAWTNPQGVFQVYLSDGVGTFGPWTAAKAEGAKKVISGVKQEGVRPGMWQLVARPVGPFSTAWSATSTVLVKENPELAASLDPRYREEDRAYGWMERLSNQIDNELARVGLEIDRLKRTPAPEPLLVAGGVVLVALALGRRRQDA
ncbi:MAG TPA: S8 family serine peptidase [Candidatus Thermoplasmatota archaeon]|nr:S8 family serine peptidase [Candidatus Thermoplasmatota archaeon]